MKPLRQALPRPAALFHASNRSSGGRKTARATSQPGSKRKTKATTGLRRRTDDPPRRPARGHNQPHLFLARMWRGSCGFLLPYRVGCLHQLALACARSGAHERFITSICREEQHRVLDAILHFLHSLYNPEGLKELIRSGGAPLICGIVFVETGFFVGFFLPGDSLLVTAGVFSAAGVIPLRWLLLPVMLCAILGDQIGYWIGRAAGSALYRREDSLFFRRSHLQRAHDFYEKYGGRAVILARFVPIVRTFCPPVAGAANMPYPRYLIYDIFGGMIWVAAMILGGYSLGRSVPNIGQRIHYVIAVVIFLSVLAVLFRIIHARHKLNVSNSQRSTSISRAEGE